MRYTRFVPRYSLRTTRWFAAGMLAACALLAGPAPARATSVMTILGVGPHETVKLYAAGSPANGASVYAGQEIVRYEDHEYNAYCVDIYQWSGTIEVVEQSSQDLNHGDLVAYLFDTYGPDATTNRQAAALGVAIWEVLFEAPGTGFNVNAGAFSIANNAGVASAANDLLATLPDHYDPAVWPTVLHSDTKQDMLISGHIPEPATMAAVALGLTGLGGYLRRRRRA